MIEPTAQTARAPAVVLLTTDFAPQVGGISEYLGGLWSEAATWSDASVLSSVPGGRARSYSFQQLPPLPDRRLGARPGDDVVLLRRLRTAGHFLALRRYARRAIAGTIRTANRDTRPFVGVWDTTAHYWCEALFEAGLPYGLFAYGLDVIQPLYRTIGPWRQRDFQRASRVIACSHGTASLAVERLGLDPSRMRVINPGIAAREFQRREAADIEELRTTLAIGGARVLLSIGRLVRRKGFDVALRAFAENAERHPDVVYVIAGDGPEKSRLEALARELHIEHRVRFAGAVGESTKLALYELCDLFVMPNSLLGEQDWEGFGIVFLEAARAGKASIAGANGGVPDAVVDGVTGRLVNPSDEPQVARVLGQMLADDGAREAMGQAARRRAVTEFDWRIIGARFREIVEEPW